MVQKKFLTYTQQIDKLKNEKALLVNDIEYTTNTLKKINYYSLIDGYKTSYSKT